MPKFSVVESSSVTPSTLPYPDDLGPGMQEELAALADIETRYEVALQRISEWPGSDDVKDYLRREIEMAHQSQREPHVLRLSELQQRLMAVMVFRDRSIH